MSKGICHAFHCGKVFVLPAGVNGLCPHCGAVNYSNAARQRYDAIPDGGVVKTGPVLPVADNTKEGRKIGKVRMDLVVQDMPRAIEALARVMTWALDSKGYKESDWLHVPGGIQKYHGGLHRHDNKEMRGQTFDDESGLHHAIHTAWNAMARVELILREEEAKNGKA